MRYVSRTVSISFVIIATLSLVLLSGFITNYRQVRKQNKEVVLRNELNEYIITYGDSALNDLYLATRAYMSHDTATCDSLMRLASRYALKRTELKNMYNLRYKK